MFLVPTTIIQLIKSTSNMKILRGFDIYITDSVSENILNLNENIPDKELHFVSSPFVEEIDVHIFINSFTIKVMKSKKKGTFFCVIHNFLLL